MSIQAYIPATSAQFIPYTGATGNVDLGAHNLTVDTNTFFVDATNNRVGIGTTTPTKSLSLSVGDSQGILIDSSNRPALQLNTQSVTAGEEAISFLRSSTLKISVIYGRGNTGTDDFALYDHINSRDFFRYNPTTQTLGIGPSTPAAPSYSLSLGGTAARTIAMERHTTADTAGNNLTIQAGGATSGATDKNGGTAIVSGGISTGTGTSAIQFYTATAGSTGTADNTPSLKMTLTGAGMLGIGTSSPTHLLELSTSSTTAQALAISNSGTQGQGINQSGVLAASKFGWNVYSNAVQVNSTLSRVHQDNASSTAKVFEVINDGTGNTVTFTNNNTGIWLRLDAGSNDTSTTATAGANGDVPAQVVGYLVFSLGGTNRKIPYYAA